MTTLPDRIHVPAFAREIAETLSAAGHDVWCVGGAVRDALLGIPNQDVDLTTSARPEEIRQLFRRTVPIGIDHGTVAVLDKDNRAHEVTSFRKDVDTDGRHATVEFGVSIDEDLARRDFTINAIAFHPLTESWKDPFGGADDLQRRTVRAVGDAGTRFTEDHLRILRALRFACRFDFMVEENTWRAAHEQVENIRRLSAERVRDEWFKGLETAVSTRCLIEKWKDVGALAVWMPAARPDDEDYGSRVGICDRIEPRDPVVITAALCDGAGDVLKELRASNVEVDRARAMNRFESAEADPTDVVSVRRWLSHVGAAADDLLSLRRARDEAPGLDAAVRAVTDSGAPLKVSDLAVDGHALEELGVEAGPRMGAILSRLLDDVLLEPAHNTETWLTDRVRELIASGE